jgi:hypothetical protein
MYVDYDGTSDYNSMNNKPICKKVKDLRFTDDVQTRDLVPYCKRYATKNHRKYPVCEECNPFYELVHKRGGDDSEINDIRDVFQCKVKHCETGQDLQVYPEVSEQTE